jgi:hypothetical protein
VSPHRPTQPKISAKKGSAMKPDNDIAARLLVDCAASHIQQCHRDGLENSLGHLRKVIEDLEALYLLLQDKDVNLPLHIGG